MRASRIFLYLCLSFLAGIALNSVILISQVFVYGGFVLGLIFISVLWGKDKRMVIFGFCLILFAGGIYRHQMFELPRDNSDYYKNYYSTEGSSINFITSFKSRLRTSLDSSLSPPQSSILGAMMLGEKERLSYDLKEKLNRSGTRHITAISGMHVMILAQILIGLGLIFGD